MLVKLFLIKKIIKAKPSKDGTQATPKPIRICKCKYTKIKVKNGTKQTYPLAI